MDDESKISIFVEREQRRIVTNIDEFRYFTPLKTIPPGMLKVMLKGTDYDKGTIEDYMRLVNSRVFEGTVGTYSSGRIFPVNLATKIIFPTLYDEIIEEIIDDLEGEILSFQGRTFEATLEDRFRLLRNIFLDDSKIDPYRLGAIEIYGELTYKNIRHNPKATILYRWQEDGNSRSIQINCIAQIEPPKSNYFRFMRVLRSLFARKFMDLLGESYMVAYKFWICDLIPKHLDDRHGFTLAR